MSFVSLNAKESDIHAQSQNHKNWKQREKEKQNRREKNGSDEYKNYAQIFKQRFGQCEHRAVLSLYLYELVCGVAY